MIFKYFFIIYKNNITITDWIDGSESSYESKDYSFVKNIGIMLWGIGGFFLLGTFVDMFR